MANTKPAIRYVGRDSLRRLAELEPNGPVVSAFLDLDPERFATPPARESQLNSILHSVNEDLEAKDGIDGEVRAEVERDLERLRSYVKSEEFPPPGAAGAAIFLSGDRLFEVYPLRRPLGPSAVVADRPLYEELVEDVETDRWIVILVNRQTARIFTGTSDRLRERTEIRDEVHRKHDQGGWSQARYQRSIEEDVMDHLRTTATALEEIARAMPKAGIVVGAPDEVRPMFEEVLPKALAERIVDRIEIDVEHSTVEEIQQHVEPIAARERARAEQSAIEELEMRIGRGERVAVGIEDVRKALFDKRVEQVLYSEGEEVPADVVGSTLEQAGTLMSVAGDALDRHGRIAALLRF